MKKKKQITKIAGYILGSSKVYIVTQNGYLIICSANSGQIESFKKISSEKKMINSIDKLFLKKTNSKKIQTKLKLIGHKILDKTYKEINYII